MQAAIAFGIFLAIVGYLATRNQPAKPEGALPQVSDDPRAKLKARMIFRAVNLHEDFTQEMIDWACSEVERSHGHNGLQTVLTRFEKAPDSEIKSLFQLIRSEYKKQAIVSDSEARWNAILNDFNKMNKAQQKSHLAYIKSHTNELNDEQLHILELISLGDAPSADSTDIMLGDMKLFSVRKSK